MKDYEALSRRHFNRQAAQYDQNSSTYYSGPAKISCADAAHELAAVPYARLLDVGCGTGHLIALLAAQRPAAYFGLDLAENMLKIARKKQIPGAEFTLGTADHLPYPDAYFDVVTCIQSFHHYPYPDQAMQEAFRVLKPGGLYLLSDTGVGGLPGWIDNHLLFPLMHSGDCRTESRKGIARRMARHGFAIIRQQKLRGFIYTVVGKKR